MKIINYDIRKVVPSFREKDFETKLFVFVIEDHWEGTYVAYVYRKSNGNFNLCGLHIEGVDDFYVWSVDRLQKKFLLEFILTCFNDWSRIDTFSSATIYVLENINDIKRFSKSMPRKANIIEDQLTKELLMLTQGHQNL